MFERNTNKAWVGGVAAGLADEYRVSAIILRLLFVITFFAFGIGLLLYWWFWVDSPENSNQIKMNFT
ncbi:MAG: PspC domain-containing protein [Candidatus Doudnabacteria bacterium]|nr:PspC domain-containing protein [Candidatus Doudnabacteria bacterium]